eukprot:symbB.v1.2.005019.t1/scaffold288.1/size478366/49
MDQPTNHDMCTAVALAEDLQIFIIQAMGCGASTAQVAPQDFRAILPGSAKASADKVALPRVPRSANKQSDLATRKASALMMENRDDDRYKYIRELKNNQHIIYSSKGMQFLEDLLIARNLERSRDKIRKESAW